MAEEGGGGGGRGGYLAQIAQLSAINNIIEEVGGGGGSTSSLDPLLTCRHVIAGRRVKAVDKVGPGAWVIIEPPVN